MPAGGRNGPWNRTADALRAGEGCLARTRSTRRLGSADDQEQFSGRGLSAYDVVHLVTNAVYVSQRQQAAMTEVTSGPGGLPWPLTECFRIWDYGATDLRYFARVLSAYDGSMLEDVCSGRW